MLEHNSKLNGITPSQSLDQNQQLLNIKPRFSLLSGLSQLARHTFALGISISKKYMYVCWYVFAFQQ